MGKSEGHNSGFIAAKAIFGLLVLIVGLYGVSVEMSWLQSPVSMWSLLVVLVGLGVLAKAAAYGKCAACSCK